MGHLLGFNRRGMLGGGVDGGDRRNTNTWGYGNEKVKQNRGSMWLTSHDITS